MTEPTNDQAFAEPEPYGQPPSGKALSGQQAPYGQPAPFDPATLPPSTMSRGRKNRSLVQIVAVIAIAVVAFGGGFGVANLTAPKAPCKPVRRPGRGWQLPTDGLRPAARIRRRRRLRRRRRRDHRLGVVGPDHPHDRKRRPADRPPDTDDDGHRDLVRNEGPDRPQQRPDGDDRRHCEPRWLGDCHDRHRRQHRRDRRTSVRRWTRCVHGSMTAVYR